MIRRIFQAVAGLGTVHDARSLEAFVMAQCKALGALILDRFPYCLTKIYFAFNNPCAFNQSAARAGQLVTSFADGRRP